MADGGGPAGQLIGHLTIYDVIEQIGSGGEADIYKVHSKQFERFFAAKVLRAPAGAEIAEVSAIRSLSHPNIVLAFDEFDLDCRHVIVFEYLEGGTLVDVLDENPRGMSMALFLPIASQLVRTLSFCHTKGVSHRDLKPANIGFKDEARTIVKLCDFGFATSRRAVMPGCGTLEYTSPEALPDARVAVIDPQPGDVWSLGMVFLACLEGSTPFERTCGSDAEVARRIRTRGFDIDTGSADLDLILARMLELEPERRISMAELARLDCFQVGLALPRSGSSTSDLRRARMSPGQPARLPSRGRPRRASSLLPTGGPLFPPDGEQRLSSQLSDASDAAVDGVRRANDV